MTPGPGTRLFLSVSAQPGGFGAAVYNALFRRLGIDAVYLPRRAPDSASDLCAALRTLRVAGCSVSMPLKSAVLPCLDRVDPLAARLASVNTITNADGVLAGFNTDHPGALGVLTRAAARSVLVYGTGSVAGTLVAASRDAGAERIWVAGRNPDRVRGFAERTGAEPVTSQAPPRVDLVVNATPAGGDPADPVFRLLEAGAALFDLRVAPSDTPLVRAARARGIPAYSGLDMGRHQIRRQFQIYTGQDPGPGLIDEILREQYLA